MENHRVVAKTCLGWGAQLNALIDDVRMQGTAPPWLPGWLIR